MQRTSDVIVFWILSIIGCLALAFMAGCTLQNWIWYPILGANLFFWSFQWLRAGGWRRRRWGEIARDGLGILGLVAASATLCAQFPDYSYDGQWYHQEALLSLRDGWNPAALNPLKFSTVTFWGLFWFLQVYAKAAWFYGGAFFKLTGQLEASKHLGLLLGVASFCSIWDRLPRRSGWAAWLAPLIALGIVANPVWSTQIFTFYVDGCLVSALLLMLAAILRWREAPTGGALIRVQASWILVANLKTSGFAYGGLMLAGAVLFLAFARGIRKKAWVRFVSAAAVGTFAAVGVFGYSTYVLNWRNYDNPFFPMHATRLEPGQAFASEIPPYYAGLNRFAAFAVSQSSCASGDPQLPHYTLKAPLQICPEELAAYRIPDARLGGFGPWFGAACLVAALILLVLAVRTSRAGRGWPFGVLAGVVLSVCLNPAPWWARLSPQAYWLPWIAVLGVYLAGERGDGASRGWLRGVCAFLGVLLLLNAGLVFGVNLGAQLAHRRERPAELAELAKLPGPIHVQFGPFWSLRYRLRQNGIAYVGAYRVECEHPRSLAWSPVRVCPAEPKPIDGQGRRGLAGYGP